MKKQKIFVTIAIIAIVAVSFKLRLELKELQKEVEANNQLIKTLSEEVEDNRQLTRTVQFCYRHEPYSTATMSFNKQGWIDFFKTCEETDILYICPASTEDFFEMVDFNEIDIPEEIKEYWSNNHAHAKNYNPWSDGYTAGPSSISFKQVYEGVSIRLHGVGGETREFVIKNSRNPKMISICPEKNRWHPYLVFEYEPTGQLITLMGGKELKFYIVN